MTWTGCEWWKMLRKILLFFFYIIIFGFLSSKTIIHISWKNIMQITNKENKTLGFVREWNMLNINLNSTKKVKKCCSHLLLFSLAFTSLYFQELYVSMFSCETIKHKRNERKIENWFLSTRNNNIVYAERVKLELNADVQMKINTFRIYWVLKLVVKCYYCFLKLFFFLFHFYFCAFLCWMCAWMLCNAMQKLCSFCMRMLWNKCRKTYVFNAFCCIQSQFVHLENTNHKSNSNQLLWYSIYI